MVAFSQTGPIGISPTRIKKTTVFLIERLMSENAEHIRIVLGGTALHAAICAEFF
jgi:hypothetical protein